MQNSKSSISLWIFVLFLGSFIFCGNGKFGGDGLENYLTAESLVLDGDLSIHDRNFQVKEMRYEERGSRDTEGKFYSSYGFGIAALLVPLYAIGHIISKFITFIPHDYLCQYLVSLFNPLVSAFLIVLLFKFLLTLGYKIKDSLLTCLIYGFCSMGIVYARSGFSEPFMALLVLFSCYLTYYFLKTKRASYLFSSSLCLSYVFFIKKNLSVFLLVFMAYVILLDFRQKIGFKRLLKHLFFLSLPPLIFLGLILWQNKLFYGSILNTEFGNAQGMLSHLRIGKSSPIKGLYYYLLSPGKGFFLFNIALIPGLFAIKSFFRTFRSFAAYLWGIVLINLAFYVLIYTRGSIFSWGPRYLFPVLPIFALPFAEFLKYAKTTLRKAAVIIFAAIGFLIQLPALIVNFSSFIFYVKEMLNLPEYLIDFMPDLSPITGSWFLLISFLWRNLSGISLDFIYNPDFKFISPVVRPLSGYDVGDIWFLNIVRIKHSLMWPVIITAMLILALIVYSSHRIIKHLKAANE